MASGINRCPSPRTWEKMLRWADKVIKETPGGDTDDEEEEGHNIQRLPSPTPSTSSAGGANPGNVPGLPEVQETPDPRRLAFEAAWPGRTWIPPKVVLTDAERVALRARLNEEERRRPYRTENGYFVPDVEGWRSGGPGSDDQDQRDFRERLSVSVRPTPALIEEHFHRPPLNLTTAPTTSPPAPSNIRIRVHTSSPRHQRRRQPQRRHRARVPLQHSVSRQTTRTLTGRVTRQARQSRGQENKDSVFWELDQNGKPRRLGPDVK